MKILLINPPIFNVIDPSLPAVLLEEEDPMPPLGLMYLASYLEKNSSHDVKILDCQIEKLSLEQMVQRVEEQKPDAVGITTMTFTLIDVINAINAIKKNNDDIKIILGGPHVHIYPEETAKLPGVDFVVIGEGELPLKGLLENFNDKDKLKNIKGLFFLENEQIVRTGLQDLIQNLDDLPFPARHLLPYKKYGSAIGKRFPVTTMFTSRGCPYKCLFCDRPHLGKSFRARSAKNVVDEMQVCTEIGIKEIFIYDDTFGADRQRVLDICSDLIKRKLDLTWDIRTRVNTVDKEVLKALKEAGCQRIHFGVEAGTQRILNVLRKGITIEMAKKAFKLTREVGIQTLGYFMIGSPTETKEDIEKTIKLAKTLKPEFAHFTITTPYPATDLYRMGLESGVLPNDYWQEFAKNPTKDFKPLIWEENLKKDELVSLLKKAYRTFYYRPLYILKRIISVSSWGEFKAKAKVGLSLLKI
ncbi:B12-binding domain-containing radical SAM protein [Patescibacteria group bacterium]|nr:B12-binding domain-containing radical SAM protein [Patescibacteria group bacterium]